MKTLSAKLQPLLEKGEALKERLISTLNENTKSSVKAELTAWFISVINQTQSSPLLTRDPLEKIYKHAVFFLESNEPTYVAKQIDRAIEIIASIPAGKTEPLEITPALLVCLEFQKLIALAQAALLSSRKQWEHFLKCLTELKKPKQNLSDNDVSIIVSQLIAELLRNIQADLGNSEVQVGNIVEEYQRFRSTVEERALLFARIISAIPFWVLSALIIIGAAGLMLGHPFHNTVIEIVIGVGVILFVVMELRGNLQHLAQLRSKLESSILPRVRRFLGAEVSSRTYMSSVLGLKS